MPPDPRPTIADIAARAGVSKMAVSLALNDRPGVSDETRARIKEIADRAGWRPNAAARSLSTRRANAVGLVLRRDPLALEVDTFYLRLLAGLEAALSSTKTTLAMHVVSDALAEEELYRTLSRESRVDAVLLTDLVPDDPRVPLIRELGMPAVVLGADAPGLPILRSDDEESMVLVLDHLASLGHVRISRVTGPENYQHTRKRTAAFARGIAERGIEGRSIPGETPERAEAAVRELLGSAAAPTALVFDSDLQAVIGIRVASRMRLRVPSDLSVVAWDGSTLSEYADPAITAVRRDLFALGRAAGEQLLCASSSAIEGGLLLDGADPSSPRLHIARSTAPPR